MGIFWPQAQRCGNGDRPTDTGIAGRPPVNYGAARWRGAN